MGIVKVLVSAGILLKSELMVLEYKVFIKCSCIYQTSYVVVNFLEMLLVAIRMRALNIISIKHLG